MLSEYDKELLTAFVDGEMTRRQRKEVLRLLHQSSEARLFLRDLQQNVHLFKLASPYKLDEAFAARVLDDIAGRGLRPTPPSPAKPRRAPLFWLATAAAAAIVVAVGLWFGLDDSGGAGGLTHRAAEMAPPLEFKLNVAFADLPARTEDLRRDLEREPRVHLDLAVKHSTHAVERVMQAIRESKIELVLSPVAAASIKKNQPRTQYLVYAEGLRPDEVVALLAQLGSDRSKAGAQAGFQSVQVTSLDARDRQQLSRIAGLQVQQRSSDEPSKDQPKTPAPSFAPERFAVVLTNSGEGEHKLDPEVQAFLSSRRELSPGAMQVLVVFTPASA